MKTFILGLFILGSFPLMANTYQDCTKKLENKIIKRAQRHCFYGATCEVIKETLKFRGVQAEEQNPGNVWYFARMTTVKGYYTDGDVIYYQLKALRSSDGKVCRLKHIFRISEDRYHEHVSR